MDKMTEFFDAEFEKLIDERVKQENSAPEWFDEESYLLANPDVAESLSNGEFSSAYQHFLLHGKRERRPLSSKNNSIRNRIVRIKPTTVEGEKNEGEVRASVEAVMISPEGGVLIIGWVDDFSSPLQLIRINQPDWYIILEASQTARFRRQDVEQALGMDGLHSFGFFAFTYLHQKIAASQSKASVELHLADGRQHTFDVPVRFVGDTDLRNTVLTYIAEANFFGNRQVEAVDILRGAVGKSIIKHNCEISKSIVAGAYVERFGPQPGKLKGSLIVCLYGKPEYMFLQNALFHAGKGFEDYELIYVCNSPELGERLIKDIRTSSLIYNLPQTLVLLPGNAGFGAANNIAAKHARSNRILIINPDVFPKDLDWAHKHTEVISTLPQEQTKIFGAPLYYDDGSLMHGGMFFEFDTGITGSKTAMTGREMIRVEHYGKGDPEWSTIYNQSRPVPAVTGAFISIDRDWFEHLSGFTEDFVFGHYEDADLCLKSISQGYAPWMHDIRMWHLEGKGSTRLPVHEGGSYVNRAFFSAQWDNFIKDGLVGKHPTHPLLSLPAPSNASKATNSAAPQKKDRKA
jgi:GT2 family glycosyltransferase